MRRALVIVAAGALALFGMASVAEAQAPAEGAKAKDVNMVGMPGSGPSGTAAAGETAPLTGAPAGSPAGSPAGGLTMFLPLIVIMGVFILLQVMASRKEKKKREEMMSSIRMGDQVSTVGGIVGTVVSLTDRDAVIRLEDGRMRVLRSAIQQVIQATQTKSDSVAELKGEAAAKV